MGEPPVNIFRLPDLGEGLTEAEIVAWRVTLDDMVSADQIVVEVETAKAVVEVPCLYAGRVVELHGQPGDVLPVDAPLLSIAATEVAARHDSSEEHREQPFRVLTGSGPTFDPEVLLRHHTAPASPRPIADEAPLVISPIVRRLARENHVSLSSLAGTGVGGVVLRRDVEAAMGRVSPPSVAVAQPAAEPGLADVARRIPLRGAKRIASEKFTRSHNEIPDAGAWVEVDATELYAARATLRDAHPDHHIGVLTLVAKACLLGLAKFSELNSYVDREREEVVVLPHVHLGIAAQTERGLVVPVVRDADQLSLLALADAMTDRVSAARAGKLSPAELTGGSFTLNNYGVFGTDGGTPIINYPEAAILGVGRLIDRPWAVAGELCIRKVGVLSLVFDHRVCDGAVAGYFLRFVADCVERPMLLLGGA